MPDNAYHFITIWNVEGTRQEVNDIISDARDLPRWWPSVYLDVQQLEPGDENGLGKVVSLYTKGWLPYTLRWSFRVTEVKKEGFTLEAWGDFVGRGIWTFIEEGDRVKCVYDWKIDAEKPLLKRFSLLFKPIFSANHRWAMARGQESLIIELRRRRAAAAGTPADGLVPPPATPSDPRQWLAHILELRISSKQA